jgi:hypothetical protein
VVNVATGTGIPATLLAHQGGWDEILLVVGPILLVVALLWLARRRITRAGPSAPGGADGALERTAQADREQRPRSA